MYTVVLPPHFECELVETYDRLELSSNTRTPMLLFSKDTGHIIVLYLKNLNFKTATAEIKLKLKQQMVH